MNKFLDEHRNQSPFNFTSICEPKGTFLIEGNDLKVFYKLYEQALKDGQKFYLTEVPDPNGTPIRFDIDFKVKLKYFNGEKKHVYTNEHIIQFAQACIKVMLGSLDMSEVKKPYFIVTEKEMATIGKTEVKDGFHIMFPTVVTTKEYQTYMRNKLVEKFGEIFTDLPRLLNTPEDIIDPGSIRNNWSVYGSLSKIANGQVYKATCAYLFRLKIKENLIKAPIDLSEFKSLVKTMSIRGKEVNAQPIPAVRELLRKPVAVLALPTEVKIPLELDVVKQLIPLLSPARADSYHTWIRVCWCLHYISETLLPEFIEFSRKCPGKFSEAKCHEVWEAATKFSGAPLTIATLRYWAKEDNPEEYAKIIRESIRGELDRLEKGSVDLANIVYKLHKGDFMFVYRTGNKASGVWFEFRDNYWFYQPDGVKLRKIICEDLHKMYKDFYWVCLGKSKEAEGDAEKTMYHKKADAALALAKSLKTTGNINNIVYECQFLFRDHMFEEKLDSNPYLISFQNGIFDLREGLFRKGIPEDYITITSPISFTPKPDMEKVSEVKKFIRDIMPNKDVRKYLLTIAASCLDGLNRDEKFYILTGAGRNGKSKFVQLLQETLGPYAVSLPISLITQKRASSDRASPEIAKLAKRRLAILKEPDNITDSVLNMGMIKDLTGNDTISCRNLYSNDNEFKVSCKIFLMCNHLPEVHSDDDGAWDRLRVINFPVHFTKNVVHAHDRLIDETIGEKIKTWKEAFLYILLEEYPSYRDKGITEPDEVFQATNKYRERNNIFLEFIQARVKSVPKKGKVIQKVSINILFQYFRMWYEEYYSKKSTVNKKEFQSFLKNYYGDDYADTEIKNCVLLDESNGEAGGEKKKGEEDNEEIDLLE